MIGIFCHHSFRSLPQDIGLSLNFNTYTQILSGSHLYAAKISPCGDTESLHDLTEIKQIFLLPTYCMLVHMPNFYGLLSPISSSRWADLASAPTHSRSHHNWSAGDT